MKKTLTILTILAIALVAMVGSVNAATTAGVDPANTQKITAGQQVKLTVTADGRGEDFKVTYDTTKFTLNEKETKKVSPSITTINPNYDGQGQIMVISLANTNTVVFTAKEDMVVPAGDPAKVFDFNITELHTTNENNEVVNLQNLQAKLTITPATAAEEEKPGTSTQPTDSTKPTEKGAEKVGTNGKVINKLPQTGAPLYMGAGVAVVLVGAALVIRKIRK